MKPKRKAKKRTSGVGIPPGLIVLLTFVGVFAILLMVVALVRGAM